MRDCKGLESLESLAFDTETFQKLISLGVLLKGSGMPMEGAAMYDLAEPYNFENGEEQINTLPVYAIGRTEMRGKIEVSYQSSFFFGLISDLAERIYDQGLCAPFLDILDND